MQIAKDSVVVFHYTVSEPGQAALESSREAEPLAVLVGRGGIIAGLETALTGRSAGERFEVTIEAEQAYGPRVDGLVQRAPKKYLPNAERLRPGMRTVVQTRQGQRLATVVKVGMTVVDLDMNHPMAGKTLHFDVEIIDVRAATEEELAHGHAHGPDGHAHH